MITFGSLFAHESDMRAKIFVVSYRFQREGIPSGLYRAIDRKTQATGGALSIEQRVLKYMLPLSLGKTRFIGYVALSQTSTRTHPCNMKQW